MAHQKAVVAKNAKDAIEKSLKIDGVDINIDGWTNVLTGLGVPGKDRRTGMNVTWRRLSEQEAETIYSADDQAAKHVDFIPDEGTRKWIEFRKINEMGQNDTELLQGAVDEFSRLEIQQKFAQAWSWARLYGGAGIFVAVDDGVEDLLEPLNIGNLRGIKSLTVLSRWELNTFEAIRDINSPQFGLPSFYQISPRTGAAGEGESSNLVSVHHTRVIRFEGVRLPRVNKEFNDWWGDSVLTRFENPLRNYQGAHDSIANVIQDFRNGILKIQDLADLVTQDGGEKKLIDRIAIMDRVKSIMKTVVLDAENESFENMSTNLSGVKDIIQEINARLVAATDLPHNVLLGEGAGGVFNNAGDAEDRNLKDKIRSEQEKHLTKPIDRVLEIVQAQKMGPMKGKPIEGLTWMFQPLTEQNDQEKATTKKTMAETDNIYILNGVLSADEVAKSRFGKEEFSLETEIDLKARQVGSLSNKIGLGKQKVELDRMPDHFHAVPLPGGRMGHSSPEIAGENGAHFHIIQDFESGEVYELALSPTGGTHIHHIPELEGVSTSEIILPKFDQEQIDAIKNAKKKIEDELVNDQK